MQDKFFIDTGAFYENRKQEKTFCEYFALYFSCDRNRSDRYDVYRIEILSEHGHAKKREIYRSQGAKQ